MGIGIMGVGILGCRDYGCRDFGLSGFWVVGILAVGIMGGTDIMYVDVRCLIACTISTWANKNFFAQILSFASSKHQVVTRLIKIKFIGVEQFLYLAIY